MGVKLYEKPENQSPGPLIAIVIIIMLLLLTSKCHAQQKAAIDTMVCKAVYVDKSAGFSEIIPISKSVVDYINTCKQFSIEPTLGIRLRNGVITSIVRYKIKFVHK